MAFTCTVVWDGVVVDGVSRVSPLRRAVDVVSLRDGGGGPDRRLPGRDQLSVVTLEREVSDDDAFDRWASGPCLRKPVELRLRDGTAGPSVTYTLHGCWISEYVVAPDLGTGTVLESLTLVTDGWTRTTAPPSVLADRLALAQGREVRTVDLSRLLTGDVVSTERNLEAALAEAEASGATLLLDEADALFSRRADVQDATDRYERTEMDAVRDRLSRYPGSVVVVPPDQP